jgi:DNA-binding transcriptional MerR regulator
MNVFTTKELAEVTGLTRTTICKYFHKEELGLQPKKLKNGYVLFTALSLDELKKKIELNRPKNGRPKKVV